MTVIDRSEAIRLGRATMRSQMEAIGTLADGLDDAFWQCSQLLARCPGLIWVTGVGTSAAVGSRFAHILTDCGVRSMFLSPSDGLHGHTGVMQAGDLLVAMSRGGESGEVNEMVRIASRLGVTTLGFVSNPKSTLAELCDIVLPITTPREDELMGYVATTSTVAFSSVCDALCAVVLTATGYTAEQLAHTHPGGAVGQALAPAEEA